MDYSDEKKKKKESVKTGGNKSVDNKREQYSDG